MRLLCIGRDGGGIERRRIDIHARARLNDIGDDETDDQRKRRERQEVEHRLAGNAADFFQVTHAGDAGGDRQENDRGNDHLHQFDEGIAERLHAGANIGIVVAEQNADGDGNNHLKIKMGVNRCFAARLRCCGYRHRTHNFLHGASRVWRNKACQPPGLSLQGG